MPKMATVRIVWVALFGVANVLGQFACCCTALAIVDRPDPVRCAKAAKPGCPHCQHSACESEPEQPPAKPLPLKPCSCHTEPALEMLAAELKPAWVAALADFARPLAFGEPVEAVAISQVEAATQASGEPFMTAYVKLYEHHVLRC